MKRRIYLLIILIDISFSSFSLTLTKDWTTSEGLRTPESVLFDVKINQIYISRTVSVCTGLRLVELISPEESAVALKSPCSTLLL